MKVLLVFAWWSGSGARSVEAQWFPTVAACEVGAQAIRTVAFLNDGTTPKYECVQMGDEALK